MRFIWRKCIAVWNFVSLILYMMPYQNKPRSLTLELICSLLILLFLYTGLAKALNFEGFKLDMYNQVFPRSMASFLIYTLPYFEIVIAASLLFEKTRNFGLYSSVILMILFTAYTSVVLLHFFKRIPCSCGGVIRALSWPQHLIFNLFFMGVSITGIILQKRKFRKNLSDKSFMHESGITENL
jgi:putative oxidoreductase